MNVTKVALPEVALAPALELLEVEELLENEDGRHDEGGWNYHDDLLDLGRNDVLSIYNVEDTIHALKLTKIAVIGKHMLYVYQNTQNHEYCDEWEFVQFVPQ